MARRVAPPTTAVTLAIVRVGLQCRHGLVRELAVQNVPRWKACSMRGQYILHQPKDDAEGEHFEFIVSLLSLMLIARPRRSCGPKKRAAAAHADHQ